MHSMEASRLGGEWPAPLQICMSVCVRVCFAGALEERVRGLSSESRSSGILQLVSEPFSLNR